MKMNRKEFEALSWYFYDFIDTKNCDWTTGELQEYYFRYRIDVVCIDTLYIQEPDWTYTPIHVFKKI